MLHGTREPVGRHPRFKPPYTDLVYQPMQELLTCLRANGFKTCIVSGGTVDFMRVVAQRVYGIPPEQVVGTTFVTKFAIAPNGTPTLTIESKLQLLDDGPGKPAGICTFIRRSTRQPPNDGGREHEERLEGRVFASAIDADSIGMPGP